MATAPIRVLLVDDDEDEYVIVGDLLRECTDRFDLSWAPTYEQGVQAILEFRCDVCLVDYRLGERNGVDLLAEVTSESGHAQVILLTGGSDPAVDLAASKAGAADYLFKGDLTTSLLEKSIRYAVERGSTLKALRESREIARSLNLAKSAFLASMSHEIRTPMNAILGMADMLWESQLTAEQRRYVEVFRRSGSALLALINDILDLSKIESGHLALENIEFDLQEVLDQAIELIAGKARAKNIVLLSHLSPGVVTAVRGDPARLRQILINLLGNAVKFTDSGEIVLAACNQEPDEPRKIEFTVTDTGIGIPSDKLGIIFDDFAQADASTARRYGGTGLGLGISRRLVEAMGGHLTASSSVLKGSTFRFALTFMAAENPRDRIDPGGLSGKRVLLIYDNLSSRRILTETLQAWGLETDDLPAAAAEMNCLSQATATQQPYSLVLIDNCLPGIDIFETVARIDRMAPGLPTVVMTSDSRPSDNSRRSEAGLCGWAVRPISRVHLHRLVCEALVCGVEKTQMRTEPQTGSGSEHGRTEAVKPARILVAEDSNDNRVLIQAYLKNSPYQVTFEEDGKAAVERFSTSDFDLILMDVQMPEMDGLTATRAIRALERARGIDCIPIVALTADASQKDIDRSANAGCHAHLSKPISKSQLISAIEKHRRQPKGLESGVLAIEPIRLRMPDPIASPDGAGRFNDNVLFKTGH